MNERERELAEEREGLPHVLPGEFLVDGWMGKVIVAGKTIPVGLQEIDLVRGDVLVVRPARVGTLGTLCLYAFEENGERQMVLTSLFVPRSERRKGNGKRLVDKALAFAVSKKAKVLRVQTGSTRHFKGMRRILENSGFSVFGHAKADPTMLFYEKKLSTEPAGKESLRKD